MTLIWTDPEVTLKKIRPNVTLSAMRGAKHSSTNNSTKAQLIRVHMSLNKSLEW